VSNRQSEGTYRLGDFLAAVGAAGSRNGSLHTLAVQQVLNRVNYRSPDRPGTCLQGMLPAGTPTRSYRFQDNVCCSPCDEEEKWVWGKARLYGTAWAG
jgi:hypothetical protein